MNRRKLLIATGGAVSASIAGCLGNGSDEEAHNYNNSEANGETSNPCEGDELPDTKTARGEAAPITASKSLPDDDSDDMEQRCLLAAAHAAYEQVRDGLTYDDFGNMTRVWSSTYGAAIYMQTECSRDRDVAAAPTPSFAEVVAVTPESVAMEITVDGSEHRCEDEITVVHSYLHRL